MENSTLATYAKCNRISFFSFVIYRFHSLSFIRRYSSLYVLSLSPLSLSSFFILFLLFPYYVPSLRSSCFLVVLSQFCLLGDFVFSRSDICCLFTLAFFLLCLSCLKHLQQFSDLSSNRGEVCTSNRSMTIMTYCVST